MSFAPISRPFIYPPPLYPKPNLIQINKTTILQNLQRPVQLIKIVNYHQNRNVIRNAFEKNEASNNLFNHSIHENKKDFINTKFESLHKRERSSNNSFHETEQRETMKGLTDFHQIGEQLSNFSHEKNRNNQTNDKQYVSYHAKNQINEYTHQKSGQTSFTSSGFNEKTQRSMIFEEKTPKTENSLDKIYESVLSRTNKILALNKDLINSYLKEKTCDENIGVRRKAKSFIETDFQRTGLKELRNNYKFQININDNSNEKSEKNSEYKLEKSVKSRFYSDQKAENGTKEVQPNTNEFKILDEKEMIPIKKENLNHPPKSNTVIEIKNSIKDHQSLNKKKEENHNNLFIQIEDKENRIDLKEKPKKVPEVLMSQIEGCSRKKKEITDSKTRVNHKRLSFDATKMNKFITDPIFESDHESEHGSPAKIQDESIEINYFPDNFSQKFDHSNMLTQLNSFQFLENNLERKRNLEGEDNSANPERICGSYHVVKMKCEELFDAKDEFENEDKKVNEENSQKEDEDVEKEEEEENGGDFKILEERRKLLDDFERCREKAKMLLDE